MCRDIVVSLQSPVVNSFPAAYKLSLDPPALAATLRPSLSTWEIFCCAPLPWATGSSASGCCQYVGSLMLLCCSTTCGTCERIMAHLSCYLPQGTALLSQHTGMGSPEVWATFLLEAQADIEVLLPPWVQSRDRMVGPLCSLPPLSYPCPSPAQGVLIQDTG